MVKIFHTCLDDTLGHLSAVEKVPLVYYSVYRFRNLRIFQVQLRSFKMFLWCIPDCDANLLADFDSLATSISRLNKLEPGTDSFALTFTDYHSLLLKVYEELTKCYAQVSEDRYRRHLISSFSSCEAAEVFPSSNETIEFLDSVHVVLSDLMKYANKGSQIESLVETLFLLRDMVYYTNPETDLIFRFIVRDWANKAACLSLLLGPVGIDKGTSRRLFIDLQRIVKPCNPEFIKLCFEAIKVPKMKPEDRLLFGEFVSRFVDFFLDNLTLILYDDLPTVREGLIIIITFLADPPANILDHTELIMPLVREQIYSVLDQASDNMCVFSERNIELDFSRGKTILDDFLKSLDEVRGDIVNLYVHIPPSPWSNSPRINGHGYFESLVTYLGNLKETMSNNSKLVPFLKHQVLSILEELLPLKLFLQNTWRMQNEYNELKDIWEQIMSLLYQTDFAIKSSFFIDDPIWYNITCLSFLVRKIKDTVNEIDFEARTKGSDVCQALMSSIDVPKPTTDSTMVGFEKETKLLIDRLERGSKHLDIVSIVGMGGIGKTTLAKNLYNEPSIRHHFHKRAFCSVTQLYRKRNVMLDILKHISPNDDEIPQMSDDDLANRLRQSLLGFRYLVVVDDIWDINVWYDLRASFPDNYNGSRVIFTTRINTVSESTPCPLPFLSDDESWLLLQLKVFHKDPCPEHLLNAGKLIAKNCKGLPLAIVVISGLLARKERILLQWNEVANTLSTFASSEGCNDIIRLSYEHLPEALKSCFLYIGAFPKGLILKAKRLTSFWIAEGFVSGKIAKNYLNDLGDRNLVTVAERSCNGGIKSCLVHDLVHDFCRAEAKEKHYMCYINNNIPISGVLYEYRISIEAEWRSFVDAKPRGHGVHSLLYFPESFVSYPEDVCELNSLQSFLYKFKLVAVLDLSGIIIDGEFPMTITTLVHLRSLSLRFSVAVYVPPDIINLWNLETLILYASEYSRRYYSVNGDWTENSDSGSLTPFFSTDTMYEVALPNDIWKMKRLKRVELTALSKIALDDVTGLFSLLPDLISFGLLFIHPTEDGDELLRRLSNVRKFSCFCIGMWDPDRECKRLPKLEILTNLESLSMTHVGDAQPTYMFSFPSTLRKMTLAEFGVPWNEFSAIMGMLPCLEVLVLQKNSFSGKRWIVEEDEQFLTIKSLTLHNLDIEEWSASVDSFPSLEKLVVVMCVQLVAIPSCFSEAVTLKSINVYACKKSVVDSAIEIQNDQIDAGNESFGLYLFGNYT